MYRIHYFIRRSALQCREEKSDALKTTRERCDSDLPPRLSRLLRSSMRLGVGGGSRCAQVTRRTISFTCAPTNWQQRRPISLIRHSARATERRWCDAAVQSDADSAAARSHAASCLLLLVIRASETPRSPRSSAAHLSHPDQPCSVAHTGYDAMRDADAEVTSRSLRSRLTIRSPFCGYNTVSCVELRGEDSVCYSNKIESVGLRKCPHDH